MINGLYSGAAAMAVLSQKQEMISANLANINSAGYRRADFAVEQIPNENQGPAQGYGPEAAALQIDFSQGRLQTTGRPLDVAMSGDGFFVVQRNGSEYMTRNGRFLRDSETNELVSSDGMIVVGEQGAITIDSSIGDSEISVSSNGMISARGQNLGQLKLVAFVDNQQLRPVNQSLFAETANSQRTEPQVDITQFAQEMSNTSPISELMSLILNSRQYEAVQKATRAISESLQEHIRA